MTKKVTLAAATAGHAEGGTALNAFDNALLVAGIGNINLLKVSSILPPEVPVVELPKIKPGALIPTAYAAMTSEVPGETVAAAVGYAYVSALICTLHAIGWSDSDLTLWVVVLSSSAVIAVLLWARARFREAVS